MASGPLVWEPKPGYIGRGRLLSPRCGAVVIALGLHAVAPGPNPVLISGMDLFPVVPNTTLPRFVNSRLVASCQLGFLIMFLLSLNCSFCSVGPEPKLSRTCAENYK